MKPIIKAYMTVYGVSEDEAWTAYESMSPTQYHDVMRMYNSGYTALQPAEAPQEAPAARQAEDITAAIIGAIEEDQNAETTRDYMLNNPEDNLSWCKPYITDDGKTAVAVNEGNAVAIMVNGEEIQDVNILAKAVNADHAYYSGWSDLHIALDSGMLHECGCSACPWFDQCDAMDELI